MTTDLVKYKKKKKAEIILKDLEQINLLFLDYVKKLNRYNKYTPVKDSLNNVTHNLQFVRTYIKKYKYYLENEEYEMEKESPTNPIKS